MHPELSRIDGVRLSLRLVEPDDAAYIQGLRTNPAYNQHLSAVTGTAEDQRAWIEAYKDREAAGTEYYFVIERKAGERCGVVRLYDITEDRFTWGSWILDHNKPRKAALESAVLSFGVGFDVLGLDVANVDVRVKNTHAEAFYRRLAMTETHRTERDIYFEYPVTMGVSKQLLPIYNKPMIYYPLSVLMLGGIRDIAIITTPQDQDQFQRTLGDGSQWGLSLSYIVQPSPDGLAQAYILAERFLDGAPSAMVLGDNIFFGHGLPELLAEANAQPAGGTVFGYHVADPERYGVVDFAADGSVRAIVEKPSLPPSNFAVTGLYFLDGSAPERAAAVTPSARGELEITTLLESYLAENCLRVSRMGRGYAWLDTGTHGSLLDAGNFVRTLEERQGMQTGSPDEIAFNQGWISAEQLVQRAKIFGKNGYGRYLNGLL